MTIVFQVAARLSIAVLACVILTVLTAASADAVPAWLAPSSILAVAQSGGASEPRVAFDTQGDAVAIWSSEDGIQLDGTRKYEVQAAYRPAGGSWQASATISLPNQSAEDASVALDGQGDAVAVWEAYTGITFVVEASYKAAGGAWEAPVLLSPEEIPGTARPEVAVDERGDAIAIWNRGGPWGGPVLEAFKPAGGSWQAPIQITGRQYGDRPQVAFDKQGDALAIWEGFEGKPINEWVLESAFMPTGGTWQTFGTISAPGLAGEPSLSVNGPGEAAVAWDQWTNGFLSSPTAQAAFKPADGTWQAPVNIVPAADELDQPNGAGSPSIAVDGQGDEVAVWTWAFNGRVQAEFRPAGGAWQAPVEISGEDAYAPQVAFDGHGDALAVWDGDDRTVQSAFKPAGGEWQAPVAIGHGDGYGPQVAFDGQGDAISAWTSEGGIQAAGYVAAGPVLNDVSIPAAGTVGQPLTFSVSPFDVWSVLGETSWSFGDGASASGTSVTHTYTAAGTYEVTLHSADTLGNVTSSAGKITIAPAPTTTTPSPATPSSPTSEPPTIAAASQSAAAWRESGKAPLGTTFSLTLNERAAVSFKFLCRVNGRGGRNSCLAEGTSKSRTHRAYRRNAVVGALSFRGHAGTNELRFQGRISRSKMLKPGRYELIVTATNPAGASAPRALDFTIVN